MNSRRRKVIIISVAAIAGLSSGFGFRWVQHDSAAGKTLTKQPSVESLTGGNPRAGSAVVRGPKVSAFAAKLELDLSMTSGVTRWLHWMTALEKAQLSDFPHMARMAKGNSVLLRMISARWIELNPQHLFDTLVATARETDASGAASAFPRSELGLQLFQDWAQRDAAAAIAALSAPDFPSSLRDLRFTVLNALMSKDPELGLRTIADWRIENYGTGTEGVARWAAANPRHAAEFALAHPAGYSTQPAMEVIGKVWANSDPEAAMTFAAGLKDKYGTALAAGIVREWAGKDTTAAAAWLAAADQRVRNRLAGPMVEIWARTDTAGAMEWIQDNLSGAGLDDAIASVLTGAAEKDVTAAANLVTGMEASQARPRAALSVARIWFYSYQSVNRVPPEAIAWLSALDPASVRLVIDQVQWQWTGADPAGFAEFLTTPASAHVAPHTLTRAASEMGRQNPERAFEWADRMPPDQREAAASSVFRGWQQSQPAAAMEWLRKLPASDPRRESFYLAIAQDIVPRGPEATQLAQGLASSTTAAREALQNLDLPEETKLRLIDRLLPR